MVLNDAVRRILRVKAAMGLLSSPAAVKADRSLINEFGSHERRELARRSVRESLVLLKNEGGVLPVKPGARVLIAGPGADSMAMQAGGPPTEEQTAFQEKVKGITEL